MFQLKLHRKKVNLSQFQLAQQSGVSLPTIQNIEAQKSNPTMAIVEKLLAPLGLELIIQNLEWDRQKAIDLGVALSAAKKSKRMPSKDELILESKKWIHLIDSQELEPREKEALVAFLMAIKDGFTSFYKQWIQCPTFDELIKQHRKNEKVIKLRRISLSYLGQYL